MCFRLLRVLSAVQSVTLFVGEKNFDTIKMHGTTIKIKKNNDTNLLFSKEQ
jgi:hypothetical protein